MRRFLAVLTLLLAAAPLQAQQFSSKAIREFNDALTPGGLFGVPRNTTATLPTCGATNAGAIRWDTTALSFKGCNGTTWSSLGGASVGGAISGGTNNTVLYIDNTGNLGSEAAFGYDTSANTLTVAAINTTGVITPGGGVAFVAQVGTFGGTTGLVIGNYATNTPDAPFLATGTTSNAIHLAEYADSLGASFDFNNGRAGTAAAPDPALIIHSRNQSLIQYLQFSSQNATGAGEIQTNLGRTVIGGSKTAITEAGAQAIIRVGIPTSTNVYGMTVFYTVSDVNGANYVGRSGSVIVQGGNSSGTATCTINVAQDTEAEDGSQIVTSNAATLTYTWTNVVSTTNCDLSLNAASSEGANTYGITWTAEQTGNSSAITVTPQ